MSKITGEARIQTRSHLQAGADVADVAESNGHPMTQTGRLIVRADGTLVFAPVSRLVDMPQLARLRVVNGVVIRKEYA